MKLLTNKTISFFFCEIYTIGISIPSTFSSNNYSTKKYVLYKNDIFTNFLWQRINNQFISNKDQEFAKNLKRKYKLI